MFPGHPWEGEPYGAAEYEWYLKRKYELDVMFDVAMKPFLEFCKEHGHKSHQLTMMITTRLSATHLPQYLLALNGRPYPARYPAGYVRPVREGSDMLEHISIREKEGSFTERNVREQWKVLSKWLARKAPRLAVWLAYWIFAREEVKNNYALMVSRNALRNFDANVTYFGSQYRTMCLGVPFGEKVTCLFTAPHAFGNINYFEPFLKDFKTWMEEPDKIPEDVLEKPYKEAPSGE
jgi:hypothetical protein